MAESRVHNALQADPSLCVGCRLCEYACSFAKEKSFVPNLARIKVLKLEETGQDVPIVCINEKIAPCKLACSTEAIIKDEQTGTIKILYDRCVLCMACQKACPFDIIVFDRNRKRILICDLCEGDPACVKICPTGAIKKLPAESTPFNNAYAIASAVLTARKAEENAKK